jgi:hypothetical protein
MLFLTHPMFNGKRSTQSDSNGRCTLNNSIGYAQDYRNASALRNAKSRYSKSIDESIRHLAHTLQGGLLELLRVLDWTESIMDLVFDIKCILILSKGSFQGRPYPRSAKLQGQPGRPLTWYSDCGHYLRIVSGPLGKVGRVLLLVYRCKYRRVYLLRKKRPVI